MNMYDLAAKYRTEENFAAVKMAWAKGEVVQFCTWITGRGVLHNNWQDFTLDKVIDLRDTDVFWRVKPKTQTVVQVEVKVYNESLHQVFTFGSLERQDVEEVLSNWMLVGNYGAIEPQN